MKNFIKPLFCSFIACLLAKNLLMEQTLLPFGLTLGIVLSVLIYLLLLRLCDGISREEVEWFRGILKRKQQKKC